MDNGYVTGDRGGCSWLQVDPIDAGTDNGFTFTAPNWETEPQGEAYKITAHYPAHPAGSFFYPYLRKLPTIGTFQFIKVKEYELSEVFHHTEDDRRYEVLKTEEIMQNKINILNGNEDVQTAIEEEREEQENHRKNQWKSNLKHFVPLTTASSSSTRSWINDRTENMINRGNEVTASSSLGPDIVPRGNRDAILNGIADSYLHPWKKDKPHQKKYRKARKNVKKYRPPRDCRVGNWSSWSACSKSCGIGEMTRRREITKHARRGGRLCPPLVETKWCGSARSCNKQYFDW